MTTTAKPRPPKTKKPAMHELVPVEPEQMELFEEPDTTMRRPEHPDFYLLSKIVNRLDGGFDPETMSGQEMGDRFVRYVNKVIDYECLDYMTLNRIMLLLQHNMPFIMSDVHLENLRAAYFEGVLVGADVIRRKSQEGENT